MKVINFDQYMVDWLMPIDRTPIRMDFIRLLISPIIKMYESFLNDPSLTDIYIPNGYNRLKELYSHNCQLGSLRHLLNNDPNILVSGKPILINIGKRYPEYWMCDTLDNPEYLTDFYDKGNNQIDYQPLIISVRDVDPNGFMIDEPEDNLNWWILDDKDTVSNEPDYNRLIISVDTKDYNQRNISFINYYISWFTPAGTTFTIKKY